MKVGLVDIASVRRHRGGALTCREAVSCPVETDELGSVLGGETDLGSKPGPETLAAPSDLGRHALDTDPTAAGDQPSPGEGDFGVDRSSCAVSRSQRSLRDREAVLPRPGCPQSLLGALGVAPPQVIEGDQRPAQLRRGVQDRMRDDWRQSHLQALKAPAASPACAAWCESGDDASSRLLPGVVDNDEWFLAEVEEDRDSRVRDQCNIDEFRGSIAKPCHGDPRELARPRRDRDIPWGHNGTS